MFSLKCENIFLSKSLFQSPQLLQNSHGKMISSISVQGKEGFLSSTKVVQKSRLNSTRFLAALSVKYRLIANGQNRFLSTKREPFDLTAYLHFSPFLF